MVTLRNFTITDKDVLEQHYSNKTIPELEQIIRDWETKEYEGRYFEMFAVTVDDTVVGLVSMYQHTSTAISAGPEIFQNYRRQGYAAEAVQEALDYAVKLGYKIAVAQVRTNNVASIALHEKLGFEVDHEYVNRKGNECYFFIKAI